MHSEVNALERSYTDNEMRVRSLVQELGSEREAITNHVERIRSSIVGANEQLKEEMSLATEEISVRLATSGEAFAQMIDTRAAVLLEKSDTAAQNISSLLTGKTTALVDALDASGFALAREFDTRLDSISTTITHRGQEILGQFETRASTLDANTERLNAALNERANQLNETLIARTREINESLTSGQTSIAGTLDDVLMKLNTNLDEKSSTFRQNLQLTARRSGDGSRHPVRLLRRTDAGHHQPAVNSFRRALCGILGSLRTALRFAGQQADGKPGTDQRNPCRAGLNPSTASCRPASTGSAPRSTTSPSRWPQRLAPGRR